MWCECSHITSSSTDLNQSKQCSVKRKLICWRMQQHIIFWPFVRTMWSELRMRKHPISVIEQFFHLSTCSVKPRSTGCTIHVSSCLVEENPVQNLKPLEAFFFVCLSVTLALLFQGDVTSQVSQAGQLFNQLIIKSQLTFHPLIWLLSVIKWAKYFLELRRWTGVSMKREHQFKIPWGRECFFFSFFLFHCQQVMVSTSTDSPRRRDARFL